MSFADTGHERAGMWPISTVGDAGLASLSCFVDSGDDQ